MQAYPQLLRDQVLRALEQGVRPREIAGHLKVSRAWIYKVQKRYRDTGIRSIRKIGGYRRSQLAQSEFTIRAWIRSEPNLTVAQIQNFLGIKGISVKTGALWHQLDKWGLTLQKNAVRHRARAQQYADRQADRARSKQRNSNARWNP
jgi:transposase